MKSKPPIESLILTIRGELVILAADLAAIYGVETRALPQAVKRNADRFPEDFCFRLLPEEFAELKSQGIVASDGRAALRSQIVTLDAPSFRVASCGLKARIDASVSLPVDYVLITEN